MHPKIDGLNEAFVKEIQQLTHTLKGTVGVIRAVAASGLVQPQARDLLDEVATRIHSSYQKLEAVR